MVAAATPQTVYRTLLATHGPQGWWPAETPFEVMVGAILTQNTSWRHVERALDQVRAETALSAEALLALDPARLAELLRPSGYYRVKTRRLLAFCERYHAAGGLEPLAAIATPRLREWLLATPGIGPETADDILLYAFARPVFVVDAYTRRLFSRLGLLGGDEDYETIRRWFERALPDDVALLQEYHALIVAHAKHACRARPVCAGCALRACCPSSKPTQVS
ncbi:endonuclease [Marichromatium gracile]|uniref:endonuclease III domain-containing protein n=1 Tax=Marichromatium gracile TaxID=1048 RepID=UPI001F194FEF|nr:endonuclease [Marichromatium gracile]MCF1183672.1 endonuclease [Marichromatium gracile]